MTTRKLNEFLDFPDDDDNDDGKRNVHHHGSEQDGSEAGYDLEAVEVKARERLRGSKRRRVDGVGYMGVASDESGSEAGGVAGEENESDYHTADEKLVAHAAESTARDTAALDDNNDNDDNQDDDDDDDDNTAVAQRKALRKAALVRTRARNTGVLYISRVPPFMKPQTLRHLLTPYAPAGLGRIFLTPEDAAQHTRRVKSGGNKKRSFTDGWVEFGGKRDAKLAAARLNGGIIGGKKGGFYHDDMWNVKYLRGFKWGDLTEQIANENAERAARVREEVRRTKRENGAFVRDVERGKMVANMERKRSGREGEGEGVGEEGKGKGRDFSFKQTKVKGKEEERYGKETAKQAADVSRVLRKIF